jgi:hypothetical protein
MAARFHPTSRRDVTGGGVECGGILWESGKEWRYMTRFFFSYKSTINDILQLNIMGKSSGKPISRYIKNNQPLHVMAFWDREDDGT